jgi:hypothetical protein
MRIKVSLNERSRKVGKAMKVYQMLELLQGLGKDDDIYCAFFTKDEADGKGEEDLDQVDFRFEGSEWATIVRKLEQDKGIYIALDESFNDYVDEALEKREDDATN